LEVSSVARIDISRHVEADPASVALLLAGPTGRELWPDAELALAPPQRSGVGFRVDFSVGDGHGRGRILIAAGSDGPIASDVRLTLSTADVLTLALRRACEEFVDGLVTTAQARSSAA
jgi:hypothetical protein